MTYAAEQRQDYLDWNRNAEADASLSAAHRRHFNGGCPNCGGVQDGMCPIDISHLAKVYSVHTLGQLRTYLRETEAEGTVWYRRSGDAEIILYYPGCVQCGSGKPPEEYRRVRIAGGNR